MSFGKNPGGSVTNRQTQVFSMLGHPTRKPPKGGKKDSKLVEYGAMGSQHLHEKRGPSLVFIKGFLYK